ncbi:MAG: hypothetical protein AAGA56_11675 [Myxococcota bacterium]
MDIRKLLLATILALPVSGFVGCSSDDNSFDDDDEDSTTGTTEPDACTTDDDCGGETPICSAGECVAATATAIGSGDPSAVSLNQIYTVNGAREVTDIDFDPAMPNRMWAVFREFGTTEDVCTDFQLHREVCASLEGRTVTIDNPGEANQTEREVVDGNAWHFMRRPTGIAIGDGTGFFATCHEYRTANFTDSAIDFMGPTLWSSDLDLHGVTGAPPNNNGSHYDMLHGTPFCMGITWDINSNTTTEFGNAYWLFNGQMGAIDHVNFNEDHGPGAADHTDGEYFRYLTGQVSRVPYVPSHLQQDGKWLYIADTGNSRVIRMDTETGEEGARLQTTMGTPLRNFDDLDTDKKSNEMVDAVAEEIIPAGVLQQPSGLTIADGVLYVSDFATSTIYAFSPEGERLGSLQLDLPASSVTGLAVGPSGRLYFADMPTGSVYQIVVQ